jgi:hypothetical protein
MLSVSTMEERCFLIAFQRGKVLIHLEKASPNTAVNIGVKEGRLYMLQGQPVRGYKGIMDRCQWKRTRSRRLRRVNSRRMRKFHRLPVCGVNLQMERGS